MIIPYISGICLIFFALSIAMGMLSFFGILVTLIGGCGFDRKKHTVYGFFVVLFFILAYLFWISSQWEWIL